MKKIVLLCQQLNTPIELSPARYQLIYELKKQGYETFVFLPCSIKDRNIRRRIDHFINTQCLTDKDIRKKIVDIVPQYIIAFTYEDARILYCLPKVLKKTIFVYFNLEIYTPVMAEFAQPGGDYFKLRCKADYIVNKIKEFIYVRQCKVFVIQDRVRRRVSAKYLIRHNNTVLVPNSYIYCEDDQPDMAGNGMVYSGGLRKAQLESLMKGMKDLVDLPITFAGWGDKWFYDTYRELKQYHPNMALSNPKLCEEEYTQFLRQFAVGLIWYCKTNDENVNNMGLSSGKFFKHLSLGQPVIVMDCPGMTDIVEKYQLGLVVHDAKEIKDAYERIIKNYCFYQKNVKCVYKRKYDFCKVIQPFFLQLQKCIEK